MTVSLDELERLAKSGELTSDTALAALRALLDYTLACRNLTTRFALVTLASGSGQHVTLVTEAGRALLSRYRAILTSAASGAVAARPSGRRAALASRRRVI